MFGFGIQVQNQVRNPGPSQHQSKLTTAQGTRFGTWHLNLESTQIAPRFKLGFNLSKTWVGNLDSNLLNPGLGCDPSSDPHAARRTPHTTTEAHATNDRNKKHNFHTQQKKKQNDITSRDLTSDLIKFQSNKTPYFSTYKGFERTKNANISNKQKK